MSKRLPTEADRRNVGTTYPLYYSWRLRVLWGGDSPFYGRSCRIIARGALNARMVEFAGGDIAIVSGNSLRKRNEREDRS